ncbi:MAG: hypothetical protein K8R86_06800 [Bacteroidales bacterium]|nr:hypothetical protein [Bacteroidales bacterium]
MKITEKILVLLIIVVLVLPAIQKEYPIFTIKELEGDFILAEKPAFSWKDWYEGKYQTDFDKYLESHIGFRNFLVRLTNQIDYDLYRVPHAEGVVVGKNDQLFEFDYIRAYTGGDFIGEINIDKKIRMLKFLQQHLKKEMNIDLILVFEPGKGSFYPEHIPDRYFFDAKPKTNYKSFVQKAKDYNIRFIDLNSYFQSIKGKTDYPLYPQYGTHWSIYGMSIAADSIINYIENIRQINMPEVYIDSFQVENRSHRPDYDVGKTLNLLWHLNEKQSLAYPVYRFEENSKKNKPMVLAVADSYYWNIFNTRIPKNLFSNEAYWYFYSKVYPDTYYKPVSVGDLNLKEEIEKQDVILLMITERFLYKFGWNFIEDAYAIYGQSSRFDKVHKYKCNILDYSKWFDSVIEKAKQKNITLEEMLEIEAEYIYSQGDIDGFLTYKGPKHFEENIRRSHDWFRSFEIKAAEKNISVDELIVKESENIFKTNHPEAAARYYDIENYKSIILNDSTLFEKAKLFADKYFLTKEESLQILAEKLSKNQ